MTRQDRSLSTQKRKLRDSMLAKRMQLPHASMLRASEAVSRHFSDHPILAFAPSFVGYSAMRSELDVLPIFSEMARFKKQTGLPCMHEDKTLTFHQWKIGDPLVQHAFGMREPEARAPRMEPAIVLVPLLAFDGEGYRLGYGSGCYDRTIAAARETTHPPLFIGVAYSMQEIDEVPTDEHDVPLDGILTELGVSMF